MLSSSPSPSGRHSRNASPRLGQPPFSSNPRGRPSRLSTPLIRRSSLSSDRSQSPNKSMDIDFNRFSMGRGRPAEDARAFALSDTLSIRLAAIHPIEMQQAFQAADPARDTFSGSVHVFPGQACYNVVTSVQTCFVWKIDLHSPFHPPTCYMFPVPPPDPSSQYLSVPFASLLPFGASREPGLILVSSSGEVRFWDSIGTGLAGAEKFSTTRITLASNELVNGLERVNSTVFVARTKTRLHRLTVTARPGTGKFVVISTPFSDLENQNSSWLSPFKILQRRSGGWDGGDIVAMASRFGEKRAGKVKNVITRGGEDGPLWVLTNKNLMKWNVNLEGGEQCEFNHEVKEIVTQVILHDIEGDRLSLDVELLDVAVDNSGDPTLLISHGPLQEPSPLEVDTTPTRVYALVRLHHPAGSDSLKVKETLEILPYELATDTRRASSPRLALLESPELGGELELVFSQFPDAFAFTSREPPYQEQLHLKSVDDMILGFNVLDHTDGQEVLLLTTDMVLAARPSGGAITKMKDNVEIGRANVLKSTIRQAMKYGIKPENPLRFQLPSIADGESLKSAAEQMSQAFLTSDPDVVPATLSMAAQLASRENALKALVTFIGESGSLGKLSQSTRAQLLSDAEKLAAARGLWEYHNEQAQNMSSPGLLPLAIEAYMNRVGEIADGDVVRTFLQSQVHSVGNLIPEILRIIRSELSLPEASQNGPNFLVQANGLVHAVFANVFQYRTQNRATYQLNDAFISPWTSEPNLLASLRQLFDFTVQLRTRASKSFTKGRGEFDGEKVQEELAAQLRNLASHLFRAYNDRLDFLRSRSQEGSGNERERNRLHEEFRALRPDVLGHLVRVDGIDYAFKLAEMYRDFHALGELSYLASANAIIPATERIRDYIHRFREDFTSELYQWYIEQGKLKMMFDQEAEFGEYIGSFFAKNPTSRISWIHNVGKQDYQRAASALFEEAEAETNRETRHLMLSIGKLASMAEGPAATPQARVQAFNTSLNFMAIHDTLLEQFNEEFGNPAEFTVESRIHAITSSKCAIPSDRPALLNLFQRILRQLLQGNALTEEDAVDLLSMKDNSGRPSDFVDALIILSSSPYMSESRKLRGVRNVWRRIYLHDSWKHIRDSANKTDYELMAKLRNSQLYKSLASPRIPHNAVVPPSEAVEVPTSEEIEARWPGMAPNQVYELSRDFAREGSVLSDDGPSDAEFLHVRKLVEEDMGRSV